MYAQQCLTLTPAADAQCQKELVHAIRRGFRFTATKQGHCVFELLDDYRTKDYVVQPAVGGMVSKTVVFFDDVSMKHGYGKDIDWDGQQWVFHQSARQLPTPEELKAKKQEEKKARAATKKPSSNDVVKSKPPRKKKA